MELMTSTSGFAFAFAQVMMIFRSLISQITSSLKRLAGPVSAPFQRRFSAGGYHDELTCELDRVANNYDLGLAGQPRGIGEPLKFHLLI
jgi:hypothetical protein